MHCLRGRHQGTTALTSSFLVGKWWQWLRITKSHSVSVQKVQNNNMERYMYNKETQQPKLKYGMNIAEHMSNLGHEIPTSLGIPIINM